MSKLKPCPFCGDDAVMVKEDGNWDSDSYEPEKVSVGCSNWECEIQPEVIVYAERGGYSYCPVNENKAISIWNTRM